MHPNEALLEGFYQGFRWRDAEAMASCYAANATFSDPVFQGLKGLEVPAMWRMLTGRARDLTVTYHGVKADDTARAGGLGGHLQLWTGAAQSPQRHPLDLSLQGRQDRRATRQVQPVALVAHGARNAWRVAGLVPASAERDPPRGQEGPGCIHAGAKPNTKRSRLAYGCPLDAGLDVARKGRPP